MAHKSGKGYFVLNWREMPINVWKREFIWSEPVKKEDHRVESWEDCNEDLRARRSQVVMERRGVN